MSAHSSQNRKFVFFFILGNLTSIAIYICYGLSIKESKQGKQILQNEVKFKYTKDIKVNEFFQKSVVKV